MRTWLSILLAAVVVFIVVALLLSMNKDDSAPVTDSEPVPEPVEDNRTVVGSATMDVPVQLTTQFFMPAEITVNRGDTVNLIIRSVDQDHAVFLMNGTTVLAPRGQKINVTVTPQQGEMKILCNDLCEAGVEFTIKLR